MSRCWPSSLIPSALTRYLGLMAGNKKHGWAVWSAMALLFMASLLVCWRAESGGNPRVQALAAVAGGNMEGKEVRFGVFNSALYATVTTSASCGAVNAMHDSFTPLGGLMPMLNIQLGEVVFGGVGSGLYGMLVFVILAVFIAGLMVGRTPEYLGKKIEAAEVKLCAFYVLVSAIIILAPAAWAAVGRWGAAALGNHGPHGLSEILYAFSSTAGNNGSAFAGFAAASTLANILLGLVMLAGRFLLFVPVLALAGNLAAKKVDPGRQRQFPGPRLDVHRAAGGHDHHRRPADVFSRPGLGTGRRTIHHGPLHQAVLGGLPMRNAATSIFQKDILKQAALDALKKLDPRSLARNPVMFVTECCALLTTVAIFQKNRGEPLGFTIQISFWLWFTVLFANFAEAVAEGRGKAQANSLRQTRSHTLANRLQAAKTCRLAPAESLRKTTW